jgi:ribonuclease Z
MDANLTLLGSGLGIPDPDRGPTHLLWQSKAGRWLIDAGGETYRRVLAAGVEPCELDGLLITHSHCDHIGGVPGLLFSLSLAGRQAPFPIYGPPTALDDLQALIGGAGLGDNCPPLELRPVQPGARFFLPDGTPVATAATAHSRPCLALRVQSDGNWCYSSDSGPSAAVEQLAAGCELLIHEAAAASAEPNHSTPSEVGALAARLGTARLVLVHFSPRWTMPVDRALDDVRRSGYRGDVLVGSDGLRLVLGTHAAG